jgi:hypothetical protein
MKGIISIILSLPQAHFISSAAGPLLSFDISYAHANAMGLVWDLF